MMIRVQGSKVQLGDLPLGMIPMRPCTFTFKVGVKESAMFGQFAVTLAYAITDYKCQGDKFIEVLLLDLRKSLTGSTEAISLYVQLSRV